MLKHQYITVEQTESFGDIEIKVNPDWNMEVVQNEQFDEYN
jgi:chromatin segregation and condensation protein Rec8/ScpA/Scc1 (kleisin family)